MNNPLPNLIIAGCHKAGTTSLFTYLMNHPSICASSTKEIHHYTPLRYGQSVEDLKNYASFFSHCKGNSKYLMEASPSYLYGKEEISKVLFKELDNPKILIILRDPTQRFISYYKHCEGKFLISKNTSFNYFFNENIKQLSNEITDTPYSRGIREGVYVDYLKYWMDQQPENIKIVFFENLIQNSSLTLKNIAEWLEIDSEYYDDYTFEIANKTVGYKNRIFHKLSKGINMKFERFFRKNQKIKDLLKTTYSKFNSTAPSQVDPETVKEVQEFYHSKNIELREYLKKNGYNELPIWLNQN